MSVFVGSTRHFDPSSVLRASDLAAGGFTAHREAKRKLKSSKMPKFRKARQNTSLDHVGFPDQLKQLTGSLRLNKAAAKVEAEEMRCTGNSVK